MPIVINILPNIYWVYNNPDKPIQYNDYNIELRKITEVLGAKSIIELDEKLDFWRKSIQYINEIKIEMEKNEFAKLLGILKKLNDVIKNAYLMNTPLIISIFHKKYLEIGIAICMYFFNINGEISFDNILKLLGLKIIGNITLTDELKKFFAFINLNKISNKSL